MTLTNNKWDLIISPRKSFFNINLKALWKYRDLISLFVKRDFIAKYKQTILGPLWFIIQPILTTLMFTILFTKVAKIPTNGIPPVLFYMSGTIAWTYFSTCLTSTSNTFISNANIFGKSIFPAANCSFIYCNLYIDSIFYSICASSDYHVVICYKRG